MTFAPGIDHAAAGERILVASCGLGASSDALAFTTIGRISGPKRSTAVDARSRTRKNRNHYATSVKFERRYDQPSPRV